MSLRGITVALLAVIALVVVNSTMRSTMGRNLNAFEATILLLLFWAASWLPKALRKPNADDQPRRQQSGSNGPRPPTSRGAARGREPWVSTLAPTTTTTLEGYWLSKPLRLGRPVRTPLGSKASTLTLCVDVGFDVTTSGDMRIHSVSLSGGGRIAGSSMQVNAATTRGEAFLMTEPVDRDALLRVVTEELEAPKSNLRRLMAARWRASRV